MRSNDNSIIIFCFCKQCF
ncbi:hypothetical protein [Snodgrassella gandavensis]